MCIYKHIHHIYIYIQYICIYIRWFSFDLYLIIGIQISVLAENFLFKWKMLSRMRKGWMYASRVRTGESVWSQTILLLSVWQLHADPLELPALRLAFLNPLDERFKSNEWNFYQNCMYFFGSVSSVIYLKK